MQDIRCGRTCTEQRVAALELAAMWIQESEAGVDGTDTAAPEPDRVLEVQVRVQ